MTGHNKGVIVLGASHWHVPRHVEALMAAGIPIVAVHDTDTAVAGIWAERTGATAFPHWEDALDAFADAIPLVLVNHADAPEVLAGIVARNRAFALEKPGTVSAKALAPIAEAVAQRGIATAVPFVNRFSPFWQKAERLGLVENWDYAHFHTIGGPPQRYLDDGVAWMLDPAISGGGALRNLGIHGADATCRIAGGQKLYVRDAMISTRMHGLNIEDYATARIETEQGQTVTLAAGYAVTHEAGSDKEQCLLGTAGTLIERPGRIVVTTDAGKTEIAAPDVLVHYNRFAGEIAGLMADRDGLATLGDLHRALDLIDAIYAAACGEGPAI